MDNNASPRAQGFRTGYNNIRLITGMECVMDPSIRAAPMKDAAELKRFVGRRKPIEEVNGQRLELSDDKIGAAF
jgi:hypothetical protein